LHISIKTPLAPRVRHGFATAPPRAPSPGRHRARCRVRHGGGAQFVPRAPGDRRRVMLGLPRGVPGRVRPGRRRRRGGGLAAAAVLLRGEHGGAAADGAVHQLQRADAGLGAVVPGLPGASYYNCQPGAEANPYTRGCSAIAQCCE
jgi:hypothetical protein